MQLNAFKNYHYLVDLVQTKRLAKNRRELCNRINNVHERANPNGMVAINNLRWNKAIIVFHSYCNWMTSLRRPYFIHRLEIGTNALSLTSLVRFLISVWVLPFILSKRNNMLWIFDNFIRFKCKRTRDKLRWKWVRWDIYGSINEKRTDRDGFACALCVL